MMEAVRIHPIQLLSKEITGYRFPLGFVHTSKQQVTCVACSHVPVATHDKANGSSQNIIISQIN